jgi:hypothetical protein
MIEPIYKDSTIVVAGTGPSITPEQIELVNKARAYGKIKVFSSNRAYQIFDTDLLHGCNYQFWDLWWKDDLLLEHRPFLKYTTRPELKGKYPGLEYIEERWIDGLSRDPSYVAAHHGTGPQAVNLAYLFGAKKIILVGWDMKFPGKVSNTQYKERRRFFGEDPNTKNHWPKTDPDGSLGGLIREMETIKPEDYGIEIINCTPGSAMTCFPMADLEETLNKA